MKLISSLAYIFDSANVLPFHKINYAASPACRQAGVLQDFWRSHHFVAAAFFASKESGEKIFISFN